MRPLTFNGLRITSIDSAIVVDFCADGITMATWRSPDNTGTLEIRDSDTIRISGSIPITVVTKKKDNDNATT